MSFAYRLPGNYFPKREDFPKIEGSEGEKELLESFLKATEHTHSCADTKDWQSTADTDNKMAVYNPKMVNPKVENKVIERRPIKAEAPAAFSGTQSYYYWG